MAEMISEKKSLVIFFGECDFNFTCSYWLQNFSNENKLQSMYEVIATEKLTEEEVRNEYGGEFIERARNMQGIHIFFGVSVRNFSLDDERWKHIVDGRIPELIRFNFPWYKPKGNTEQLVKDLFDSAFSLLCPKGKLIVSLHEGFWDRYGVEDAMNGKFKYLEKKNIHAIYPGYTHRSSIAMNFIVDRVKEEGFEYHFQKFNLLNKEASALERKPFL